MLYVLKMTNTQSTDESGTPNDFFLVGPFKSTADCAAWAEHPRNNPHDNPMWQVIELDNPHAPVRVLVP
jgi:hypothetical protein